MTKNIQKSSDEIPVLAEYDVVVCGGGPAGCAAAIAAARNGARTLLAEKYGFLGGAAVAQLVHVVLSTNGVDFQGIWHEWAGRLMKAGFMPPLIHTPAKGCPSGQLIRSSADPEGIKLVWDRLMYESGAESLFMAHVCDVCLEDNIVTGVVLHTRAGLRIVRAARVIDATGDAVVCHQAGVPWDRGVTGKPWAQKVALNRRFGGIPVPGTKGGKVPGAGGSVGYRPETRGWVQKLKVDPLDPFQVSETLRNARSDIHRQAEALSPGHYLLDTACELGVRTSRIVQGIDRVTDDDAWNLRKRKDAVARSSWEIDIHPPDDESAPERTLKGGGEEYVEFSEKLAAGEWFDIPYGALVASEVDNLLVAGRCISAGYHAQGSLRIQQTCMATGQAAGTAAAISLEKDAIPRKLNPMAVVAQLEKDRDVEPVCQP